MYTGLDLYSPAKFTPRHRSYIICTIATFSAGGKSVSLWWWHFCLLIDCDPENLYSTFYFPFSDTSPQRPQQHSFWNDKYLPRLEWPYIPFSGAACIAQIDIVQSQHLNTSHAGFAPSSPDINTFQQLWIVTNKWEGKQEAWPRAWFPQSNTLTPHKLWLMASSRLLSTTQSF